MSRTVRPDLSASVVIITRNRRRLIEEHVPVLLADPAATEVIVVDDGSTDGTDEVIDQLGSAHPNLVPVSIPHSGMDHARRTGVAKASCELLVLMDDDIAPSERLVSRHVEQHRSRDGLVVVGYMPVDDTAATDRPGAFATRAYSEDYEVVVSRWERDPDRILLDLWNGQLSVRRSDYLRARSGDETWPTEAFFEDRHLGLQFHRLGLAGRFDRKLVAVHRHRGDLASFRSKARMMGYGRWLLHERHRDLLGTFDPDEGLRDLPEPWRTVARLGDRRVGPSVSWLLQLVSAVAGRLRWWWLEDRTARLMRRVELRVGSRLAAREQPR